MAQSQPFYYHHSHHIHWWQQEAWFSLGKYSQPIIIFTQLIILQKSFYAVLNALDCRSWPEGYRLLYVFCSYLELDSLLPISLQPPSLLHSSLISSPTAAAAATTTPGVQVHSSLPLFLPSSLPPLSPPPTSAAAITAAVATAATATTATTTAAGVCYSLSPSLSSNVTPTCSSNNNNGSSSRSALLPLPLSLSHSFVLSCSHLALCPAAAATVALCCSLSSSLY